MDYLSVVRTRAKYTCKCGAGLEYRINGEGEYEIFCSADREHQGYVKQPTNRDAWAESFWRQERIMKGEK